ncbi:MAG: o-succinylbenzoate synthase [Acidimicrobiia bacterium]
MRIERVELREIAGRLKTPFITSFGSVQDRRILLVRVEAEGLEGWGECGAEHAPDYSSETVDTAWTILTGFAVPALLGDGMSRPEEVPGRLGRIRGHPMAKAALEGAVWDLIARSQRAPLWKLLGGARRPVPAGVSVGLQTSESRLLDVVEGYLAEGYLRVKLKIEPGRDLKVVEAVRKRWPEVRLTADANGAYRLEDGAHLRELDAFRLDFLEQPLAFDDLHDHARLANRIETPLCLDESIRHARDARLAIELGAAGVINIKPGRVGGLSESVAIHEVARERGIPVWCGGMLESGIGRAHNVALATLPGFTLPGDISASSRYWERDVVDPPWILRDGHLEAPDRPGIGVEVDQQYLARMTVRTWTSGS